MLVYLISFSIVGFCGMTFFRLRRSNVNVEANSNRETIETLSETRRQQMEEHRQQLPRISQTSILRCLIKDYLETERYKLNFDIFDGEHPGILNKQKMTTLIFARFSKHYPAVRGIRGINALISLSKRHQGLMELTQWGSTYDALFYYMLGDVQHAYSIIYKECCSRCGTADSLEAIPSIEAINWFCLEAEQLITQYEGRAQDAEVDFITSTSPANSGETSDHQGQEHNLIATVASSSAENNTIQTASSTSVYITLGFVIFFAIWFWKWFKGERPESL